jgi:tetratricopeptide (TPR) repeat protein
MREQATENRQWATANSGARRFAGLLALLLLLLTACGSAFQDAMDRGDQLAASGDWDRAAEAYEAAMRLDPDDEDARFKLRWARAQAARERVAEGLRLVAQGRVKEAMLPFSEAMKLDRQNREAREGYEGAKSRVMRDARAALDAGKLKEGYELARHVLLFEPRNAAAEALESEARSKIADAAVARAAEHEKGGRPELALVDYGEALRFVPAHTTALERKTEVRRALRLEITYWVGLKNFDGEKKADDFGADVNADTLSRGLDASLPLRVVSQLPPVPKGASYKLAGMRLGGIFRGYDFDRSSSRTTRACDYVCGKETVPNPEYPRAEAEMRASQAALGSAEGRVNSAKASVPSAEQTVATARQTHEARRSELSQAEQDLSRCLSSQSQAGACSAERARRDRLQNDERTAADALAGAERALESAKRELREAESALSRARMDAESKRRAFDATPTTMQIDKHCTHRYSVETVTVSASVECALRGEGLYDTDAVLVESVRGQFGASDESFPAQPGLCAEVATADPLRLPAEPDVRRRVLASAIGATQARLLAAFGRYRDGFVTRARQAEKDGRPDDAAREYVRFLLTRGDGEKDPGAFAEALAALARLRGIEQKAVEIALSP